MNAPIKPALLRAAIPLDADQPAAPSASRYVWEGKFGSMVIEVVDGLVYVNGEAVEPMRALDACLAEVCTPEPGTGPAPQRRPDSKLA